VDKAGSPSANRTRQPSPWAYLLWPLGMVFLGVSAVRAWWFRRVVSPVDLGRPTVSVGNLTFGGTGKTPVTIYLARLLQEMGERPAVLLRGYGRQTTGARRVLPESRSPEVGEEAVLLARSLPGVPVAVGERREEAATLVRPDCSVFVLDDGFQHLRARRDVDLLLVDATRPSDLHAPPVGRLRESVGAARRAAAVIVTRGAPSDLPEALRPAAAGKPVLGVTFQWAPKPHGQGDFAIWSDLSGKPLLAFAGIGNPEAFFAQARAEGLTLGATLPFDDHAEPSPSRLALVLGAAEALRAPAVLTTEKDAVKWAALWPAQAPPLVHPVLEVRAGGDVGNLLALITAALGRQGS
jgi:tetraacyldisaccharide 4'-kinase